MEPEASAHHRALAAFATEHKEALESYAGNDKATAELAAALLGWNKNEETGR
jgi:hypothetical protein